jgi:hypothetical protein
MSGTNAGTGQPIRFFCGRCRRQRDHSAPYGLPNTTQVPTGRVRLLASPRPGVRMDHRRIAEYACSCGYRGWSRHVELLRRLDRMGIPDARPAKIGPSINTRTEKHGDDNVAALDIPVTFLLDPVDLCDLLKSEDAAQRLFRYSQPAPNAISVAGDPAIPVLKSFALGGKIEGVLAVMTFDALAGPIELRLTDAKLAKMRLEPQFAGKTLCAVTIQTAPDLTDDILALLGHMNGECQISIEAPNYGSQAELPLGAPPAAPAAEEEAEEETADAEEDDE